MERARRALLLLSLLCLAVSVSPSLRPAEIRARLHPVRDARSAFDSEFRSFLEGVRARTPESATVAVFAPENEAYLREAAYELAPRRVVSRELSDQARYLAVYRRGPTAKLPSGAVALPGGFLLTR